MLLLRHPRRLVVIINGLLILMHPHISGNLTLFSDITWTTTIPLVILANGAMNSVVRIGIVNDYLPLTSTLYAPKFPLDLFLLVRLFGI